MNYLRSISFASLVAMITGCSISTPFKWVEAPVHDSSARVDDDVLIALTHAHVDSAQRKLFDDGANRVLQSLPSQPGLVGYSVRKQLFGDEVWTATVWTDETAMLQFVRSPDHVRAVRDSSSAVRNIEYVRLHVRRSALPVSWSQLLLMAQTAASRPVGASATSKPT
ncbi:antibiotic biosynthesis monooxygenase [Massilia sp. PWRC2]|uniref:antibiotic biosynthesis monooxygenase n=1 Tax=Massilia sp. PWRC2 TaxID=2804626 RepID=UPI003CF77481